MLNNVLWCFHHLSEMGLKKTVYLRSSSICLINSLTNWLVVCSTCHHELTIGKKKVKAIFPHLLEGKWVEYIIHKDQNNHSEKPSYRSAEGLKSPRGVKEFWSIFSVFLIFISEGQLSQNKCHCFLYLVFYLHFILLYLLTKPWGLELLEIKNMNVNVPCLGRSCSLDQWIKFGPLLLKLHWPTTLGNEGIRQLKLKSLQLTES